MALVNIEISETLYTLEFNRRALVKMEEKGFAIKDVEVKIFTSIEFLFWGALLKHHNGITLQRSNQLLDEVLKEYDVVEVLQTLQELLNEVLNIQIPNENTENENEEKPIVEKKKLIILK